MGPQHRTQAPAIISMLAGTFSALAVACSNEPAAPSVPLVGYVVGTVTRAGSGPALASVKTVPAPDSCTTAPQKMASIPLTTDSLGRYAQIVLVQTTLAVACVRIVAADYLVPDDSVVSPLIRLPLRVPPDTVRMDLVLP